MIPGPGVEVQAPPASSIERREALSELDAQEAEPKVIEFRLLNGGGPVIAVAAVAWRGVILNDLKLLADAGVPGGLTLAFPARQDETSGCWRELVQIARIEDEHRILAALVRAYTQHAGLVT